jgi:hypothetical protein
LAAADGRVGLEGCSGCSAPFYNLRRGEGRKILASVELFPPLLIKLIYIHRYVMEMEISTRVQLST